MEKTTIHKETQILNNPQFHQQYSKMKGRIEILMFWHCLGKMPTKYEKSKQLGFYHAAIVIFVLLVSAGTRSILSFCKHFCDAI